VWVALTLLVVAVLVASLPLPQVDLDTYRYAKIGSRVAAGHWLQFRDGEWLIDKPPLQFWLLGASFAAFGVSNTTIRAWHVILAVLLLAATVLLAREAGLSGEDAALAGLILATSVQFLYQAIIPLDDVPMTIFGTFAVVAALRWRRTAAIGAAAACGAALAGAVLGKGVAACAVFALAAAAIAWGFRSGRPGRDASPRSASPGSRAAGILAALAVFAAIVGPWFAVGASREGMEFVRTFLTGGTIGVGRYFRPASTTLPPYPVAVLTYVPLLFMAMLPWSPVVVAGLVAWRRRGTQGLEGGEPPPAGLRAVALWAGAVFVVLSLSASDRVFRYLLPCLPPLAVCAAWVLPRLDADGVHRRIAGWVALLPGVMAFGFGFWWLWTRLPAAQDLLARIIVPVFAALGIGLAIFGVAALQRRMRLAVLGAVVATTVGWALFEWGLAVHSRAIDPWPEIAGIAVRARAARSGAAQPGATQPASGAPSDIALVGSSDQGRHALVLYLGAEPATLDRLDAVVVEWRRRPLIVVAPVEQSAVVEAALIPAPARIYRDLGRQVVFLNAAATPSSP
jgi:4-amino-4-deoxy-L-arabinose transferase-like glycosyltransferase